MPTTTAGSHRVETVVTGETRQYLENGKERMLRSRQEISEMKERLEIIPYMDKTLASNRRRYLQLMRAFLKRDMVTLIEVDEVREHAGVFLVGKPGNDTQRLIIDARVSNQHFLPPPGVSLVTLEGLSRVGVAVENEDEDSGELSRLAGLHLGLVDVNDAFHRFKISKLYRSFFAFCEVEEVGAQLIGRVCTCFSNLPMGHTWSLFFCQKAIEDALWATPGLGKAVQDTRSWATSLRSGR